MKDDTISRAAAIDAVNNMIRRKFGISADLGTGALLELPSVTDTNVGGNLIDRQAAIEAMRKAKDKSELHRMLVQLPSAQPGWIPLGAPMNSGQHYLVTLRQKFEGEETYRVRIMRLHEGHWLYPHHFPEWINDEIEQEVVAWMPLPKPWEGEKP